MRRYDYVWEGSGMYRMPCMECGTNFSAKRTDACYCSANCRKKANRRKAQVQEAAQLVTEQLKFLRETRNMRPDLESEVRSAFNVIRWQLYEVTGSPKDAVHPEV